MVSSVYEVGVAAVVLVETSGGGGLKLPGGKASNWLENESVFGSSFPQNDFGLSLSSLFWVWEQKNTKIY